MIKRPTQQFVVPAINSNFHKKKNLDKNSPYNGLENDIYSLRNEGNILLMGDFNA